MLVKHAYLKVGLYDDTLHDVSCNIYRREKTLKIMLYDTDLLHATCFFTTLACVMRHVSPCKPIFTFNRMAFAKEDAIRTKMKESKDKPYICGICDKQFTAAKRLKTHIVKHSWVGSGLLQCWQRWIPPLPTL